MKRLPSIILFIVSSMIGSAASLPPGQSAADWPQSRAPQVEEKLNQEVEAIFRAHCAWCHGGQNPKKDLNLEPGIWEKATIGIPSTEQRDYKIVDPDQPEKSYLLMKVRGEREISGEPMPTGYPLYNSEIRTIQEWIYSLTTSTPPPDTFPPGRRRRISRRDRFAAPKLINLSTTHTIGKKEIMFLAAHRFYPEVGSGRNTFFGLDGPAAVMLSLGYGISRSLGVVLSRTNRDQEIELALKWKLLNGKNKKFPLEAVLQLGGSLVTREFGGRDLFDADNLKLNAQLSVSYALTRQLALLLVPSYTSNANHWSPDPGETLSLGMGMAYHIGTGYSLIAEWIPILSGYNDYFDSWAIGIEKKIGRHVFQVFIANTVGVTTDQYITGGDLKLGDGDFRLGFNIFRMF